MSVAEDLNVWCSRSKYLKQTVTSTILESGAQVQWLVPTEDIGESWRMANVLGAKGIPNRVDSWGAEYRHDWVTWREMLPKYLAEYA